MAEESTMAMTGRTNADWSERRSATHPIIVGEGTSPRMWMMKILTAMAVARMWAPTELINAAFNGEVLKRRKKAATAMAGIMALPGTNKAMIMTGTPSAMLTADTR